MKIELTQRATDRIQQMTKQQKPILSLHYDNEGCGCAVNGVPLLKKRNADEVEVNGLQAAEVTSTVHIYYQPLHAVYFESQLKIDYHESRHAFTLSSEQQIYSHDLRVAMT
jgi:uncharacterized protein YqkB